MNMQYAPYFLIYPTIITLLPVLATLFVYHQAVLVSTNCRGLRMGYYAAQVCSCLPMFQDILLDPSSKVKQPIHWTAQPLQMGLMSCPETLVNSYQPMLHKSPKKQRPEQYCDRCLKSEILIVIKYMYSSGPQLFPKVRCMVLHDNIFSRFQTFEKCLMTATMAKPYNNATTVA